MESWVVAAGLGLLAMPAADPPLTDLLWFPPAVVARSMRELSQKHQEWVGEQYRKAIGPCEEKFWMTWGWEARVCEEAWGDLCSAYDEGFDPRNRRAHLGFLRDKLAPEYYYAGRMPPPVPLWRFARR